MTELRQRNVFHKYAQVSTEDVEFENNDIGNNRKFCDRLTNFLYPKLITMCQKNNYFYSNERLYKKIKKINIKELNETDKYGKTPILNILSPTCWLKKSEIDFINKITNYIIDNYTYDVDLTIAGKHGNIPIHYMVMYLEENLMLKIIELYSPEQLLISNIDYNGNTVFSLSCRFQTEKVILKMIDKYSPEELLISNINRDDETAFSKLCKYQSEKVILKMIDKFSPEQLGGNSKCLENSIVEKRNNITKILMEKYKASDLLNNSRYFPFYTAIFYKQENIVIEMMKKYSPSELKINHISNFDDYTPLIACCKWSSDKLLLKMIEKYSAEQLNLKYNSIQGTAFMICCKSRTEEIIFKMLEKFTNEELNITAVNKQGKSALTILINQRDKHIYDNVYERLPTKDLVYLHYIEELNHSTILRK